MKTYVVVVERGKTSRTVGPYHQQRKAYADADRWNIEGQQRAWAEPVIRPEDFEPRTSQHPEPQAAAA